MKLFKKILLWQFMLIILFSYTKIIIDMSCRLETFELLMVIGWALISAYVMVSAGVLIMKKKEQ